MRALVKVFWVAGLFALPAFAQETRSVLMPAGDGNYPLPSAWQVCGPLPVGWSLNLHALRPPRSAVLREDPVQLSITEQKGDACHVITLKLARRLITPALVRREGRIRWRPELPLQFDVMLPLPAGWGAGDVPATLAVTGLSSPRPLVCSLAGCVATFPFASPEEARRTLVQPALQVMVQNAVGVAGAAGWALYEPDASVGAARIDHSSALLVRWSLPDRLDAVEMAQPGDVVRLTSVEAGFLDASGPIACTDKTGASIRCELRFNGLERALALGNPVKPGDLLSATASLARAPGVQLDIQVAVAASAPEQLTFVSPSTESRQLTLPGGRVPCGAWPDAHVNPAVGTIVLTRRLTGRFVVSTANGDCSATTTNVLLHVVPPVLLQSEVQDVLLDWNPSAPTHLRVSLHSQLLATDDRLRAATALVNPSSGIAARAPTSCEGDDGHWCAFDLERPEGWEEMKRVSLSIAPDTAVRASETVYRPDGNLLTAQDLKIPEASASWKMPPGADRIVGVLRAFATGLQQVEVRTPLARLFEHSGTFQPCMANDGTADKPVAACARVAAAGPETLTLEIDGNAVLSEIKKGAKEEARALTRLDMTLDLLKKPSQVTVRDIEAGPALATQIPFRLIVAGRCTYAVTQLTETYDQLGPGLLFFKAKGESTERLECPGPQSWTGWRMQPVTTGPSMDVLWFEGLALDIFAVQLAAPVPDGGLGLKLLDRAGQPVGLASGDSVLVRRSDPKQLRDQPTIRVTMKSGDGSIIRDRDLTQFGLAEGRENRLELSGDKLERWRLRFAGTPLQACPGTEPLASGSCVQPYAGTSGEVSVVAEYLEDVPPGSTRARLRPPLALASLFSEDRRRFVAGTRSVKLGTIRTWKTAIDLDQRAWVECGKPSSPDNWSPGMARTVKAWSDTSPKAASVEELRTCALAVDLSRDQLDNPCIPQAACRARANESARHLLEEQGDQELEVELAVLAPGTPDNPEKPVSTRKLRVVLDQERVRRALEEATARQDNDADVVYVDLNIDPNGANPVPDYGIVRVTARHHVPSSYLAGFEDSVPGSVMEARIRRMPSVLAGRFPDYVQQALHLDGGSGARAYVTFSIPTAMVRSPNLDTDVTSSTRYDKIGTVLLGLGGAAVLEPWDFDRNVALFAFNPQFHLGFFLSELPQPDRLLPRVSIVAGVGARLPFGLAPYNRDTNLRTVLWYEMSRRARSEWEAAVVAGFAVNFGTFPN